MLYFTSMSNHRFYIVMNETTKFTSHVCHVQWHIIVRKTIFCCSERIHDIHPEVLPSSRLYMLQIFYEGQKKN
jgi:hypothetical protein